MYVCACVCEGEVAAGEWVLVVHKKHSRATCHAHVARKHTFGASHARVVTRVVYATCRVMHLDCTHPQFVVPDRAHKAKR